MISSRQELCITPYIIGGELAEKLAIFDSQLCGCTMWTNHTDTGTILDLKINKWPVFLLFPYTQVPQGVKWHCIVSCFLYLIGVVDIMQCSYNEATSVNSMNE